MRTTNRDLFIALFLVFVAVIVRLAGLNWGLPQVYEEAIPLRKAWEMWGWGAARDLDLNPHFFNYPSLLIYLNFLGQAVLYPLLRLAGEVDGTLAFRALYVLDPTPFLITGRLLATLFAAGTVWFTYRLGRRIGGELAGLAAALLVALNPTHILRSQMVEVDVPLTFFVVLGLWATVRLVDSPRMRYYLLAGLAAGLAASTKYTGALLLLPLATAHFTARARQQEPGGKRRAPRDERAAWDSLAWATVLALAAFALTSPYVILDFETFRLHFAVERNHMQLGHFGLDEAPAWAFYARALATRVLGWPAALLGLGGFLWFTLRRRCPRSWVLAAFILPYALAVGSWAMKADRYLLPLLPLLLVFAGSALASLLASRRAAGAPAWLRLTAATVGVAALVGGAAPALPALSVRLKPDPRTRASEWIAENVPSASMVAMEADGPRLMNPLTIWLLERAVRERIGRTAGTAPMYAVQHVPMYQVGPERATVFYDPDLYAMVDYFVTTSTVRARYEAEPVRFGPQVEFYRWLDAEFTRAAEFPSPGGNAPTVVVYRNPRQTVPFARRDSVSGPVPLKPTAGTPSGEESFFYYNLGINFETFRHYEAALASYGLAFRYPVLRPGLFPNLGLAVARCLADMGRAVDAVSFLEEVAADAPTPRDAQQLLMMREQIRRRAAGGG